VNPDEDWGDLPVARSWQAWGEVFTNTEIWERAVREIGRRAALPVRTIDSGFPGSNAVFVVNERGPDAYVVKIYAPLCPEDYDLERTLHPLLNRKPEIGAPSLLAAGTLAADGTWPYIVLTLVPGEPLRDVRDDLSDTNLLAIARDLGRRVRALHTVPLDALTGLATDPASWRRLAERSLSQTLNKLRSRKILSVPVLEKVPQLVHESLEAPETADLVLVSGDLTEDHIFLKETRDGWAISGLIDFADALVAPPAYEWVALWFSALDRDPSCLQATMAGYGDRVVLDAAFYRNALAFTFLHEFGAEIISDVLQRLGRPRIDSIQALQAHLWEPA
jgi:Ser/Thr protein kinase RdoA (MazF antagonist)